MCKDNTIIKEETYQLSNLLHKLTEALVPILKSKKHSLVYKIDSDIPRYLVGDSERLYQVLYRLLHAVLLQSTNRKVLLSLKIKNESTLLFSVTTSTTNTIFTIDEIKNLFLSPLKALDFSVMKELIASMKGSVKSEKHKKRGIHFVFEIPYIPDAKNKSSKNELKRILTNKQALVVDNHIDNTEIVTEILKSLSLKVSFLSSENMASKKPNLEEIDFLIIRAEDITQNIFSFFKSYNNHTINIIVIHSIYDVSNSMEITSFVADAALYSPLITGDVEEVFKDLLMGGKKKNQGVVKDELQGFKILDVATVSKRDFQMFKDKNILIVENNFIDQQFIGSILNTSNMDVHKVENGQEALDFLDTHEHIDLIFMDINMPVMDGLKASSKIRKHKIHGNVPIIALTGLGLNYEMEQMILAGITACIVKPYKVGQVYIALERFLEQKGLNKVYIEQNSPEVKQRLSILDVKIGIKYTRGEDFYGEMLLQSSQTLKNSDVLVKDMILKDQLEELKVFCVDTVGLSATIGAESFTAFLNTMLQALSEDEDVFMSEYIAPYKKEWLMLDEEIKRYLMK